MTRRARWLFDTEIDGVPYRWSDTDLEVPTAAGVVLAYRAGLGDAIELAQAADDVELEVLDPALDWTELARELDGRFGTLRRWLEGTVFEAAETYARGEVVVAGFGTADEPVSLSLATVAGDELGLGEQVPDVLARVDETTWPATGGTVIGTAGASYPVIFGFPGFTGSAVPVCVVPVPIGQYGAIGSTFLVVGEDPDQAVSQVRIRNDEADVEANEAVVVRRDLLGRPMLTAGFGLSAVPFPSNERAAMFAGFHPSTGGGPRNAYDVVCYLLRRWGASTVDWSRLPELADLLAEYQVDTWIDAPLTDPWTWIESTLVRDLDLEVRVSSAGRYLVARRFVGDGTRLVGSVSVDRGEAFRVSELSFDGRPVNEFTAVYRENRDGDYTARVVLAGAPVRSVLAPTVPALATATQVVTTATTRACLESHARFRRRQDPDGVLELDWSWDTGTVLRCLERRAERRALPAILGTYEFTDGEDLVEGDEIELWDEAQGFRGRRALVDAPPVRGTVTTAELRIAL